MMTRRQALKTTALATAAVATVSTAFAQTTPAAAPAAPTGAFTLPPLPYAYDALEPHIDARTMEIHHDKHHAAYVAKLNEALPIWTDFQTKFPSLSVESLLKDLISIPEKIRPGIRNNGGGHYNHSLFWQMMKKDGGGKPKTELAKAIETRFESFSSFKEQFTKAALGQFGSGWVWLVIGSSDKFLEIVPTANQDSPLSNHNPQRNSGHADASLNGATRPSSDGDSDMSRCQIPLLGLDVWEHAYYLKYQNKRADYIAAWWNVVNWDFVAERYSKLK